VRRTTWAAAALAIVAVSAGCGSTGGNHTASTAGTAGSGATGTSTIRAKAVKFAECVRANGVSAFPDPDASGALTIDAVANGASLDTDSAAFRQALSTCKGLEPAGFTGRKRSAQQQKAALRFAQCIRDNGVKEFPDPGPDDPMIDTRRIPSSGMPGGMSILHAAMQKCRGSAAGAGVSRP
jgi:hypothetical protein